ncbi:MCE family protein [Gordonia rubripertincta]|uniref:MCE family protein n=1 Tax=Gordonia rubripertincta TaxID=36822 RepID=UPI000B8DABA3|nr:MCE family protein [Gordonia rubripertincta]ASR01211.1 mce related protein [Gordonia rubripertincta]
MRLSVSSVRSLAKVVVVAAVSVLLFFLIMNAVTNPVKVSTKSYSADFTDVSGLRPNGDVRVRGVQVGKVKAITIVRDGDRSVAKVDLTVDSEHPVTSNTTLAVKYQNLTGIRYIDMVTTPGGSPVDHVELASTTPSFDITELFNGLQPVLETLDVDEINAISQNALTLLEGDGGGLQPMLDSIQRLGDYAQNREQVISTLVSNLARVSDSFGGKSDEILEILHSIEVPVDAAISVLDEFIATSILGPQFTIPVAGILRNLGLEPGVDYNKMIADAFGTAEAFGKALRVLPGTLSVAASPRIGLSGPGGQTCSKGEAQLPADVTMLLNGTEVTVCKA